MDKRKTLNFPELKKLSDVILEFVKSHKNFSLSELLGTIKVANSKKNRDLVLSFLLGTELIEIEELFFCKSCGVHIEEPQAKICPCCQSDSGFYSEYFFKFRPTKKFRLDFMKTCCMCGQVKPVVVAHENGKNICQSCLNRLKALAGVGAYEPKKA